MCQLGWVQQAVTSPHIYFLPTSWYFVSTANILGVEDSSASVPAPLCNVKKRFALVLNMLISHSRNTFLSLVMPKRSKAIVRTCGGFVSNLLRTMPNSGKGESKACGCGLDNAKSDGLRMSTKPYRYLEGSRWQISIHSVL